MAAQSNGSTFQVGTQPAVGAPVATVQAQAGYTVLAPPQLAATPASIFGTDQLWVIQSPAGTVPMQQQLKQLASGKGAVPAQNSAGTFSMQQQLASGKGAVPAQSSAGAFPVQKQLAFGKGTVPVPPMQQTLTFGKGTVPAPPMQQQLAFGKGAVPAPPMQQQLAYGKGSAAAQSSASIRPIVHPGHEPREDDELAAVIVTISSGSSYDQLFSTVAQMAAEGKRVATYAASPDSLAHIQAEMMGSPLQGVAHSSDMHRNLRHLVSDIRSVTPDSVVFNWECCSGCHNEQFEDPAAVMGLAKVLLDCGHMVMFSDFSLKALIASWDESKLGPNPFVRLGSGVSQRFQLRFDTTALAACPSAQLQKLGELAPEGEATVGAMSDTIAFTVNFAKANCSAYACEVLTVMTQADGQATARRVEPGMVCTVGTHQGVAGHVLLTYPSGGRILASAGHWMELSQLDVSEENLMKAAAFYGQTFENEIKTSMAQCTTNYERQQTRSAYSCQMVQQCSPCSYSSAF